MPTRSGTEEGRKDTGPAVTGPLDSPHPLSAAPGDTLPSTQRWGHTPEGSPPSLRGGPAPQRTLPQGVTTARGQERGPEGRGSRAWTPTNQRGAQRRGGRVCKGPSSHCSPAQRTADPGKAVCRGAGWGDSPTFTSRAPRPQDGRHPSMERESTAWAGVQPEPRPAGPLLCRGLPRQRTQLRPSQGRGALVTSQSQTLNPNRGSASH